MNLTARVNQQWYVKVKGETALRTVKIIAETEKIVSIFNLDRPTKTVRNNYATFKCEDVEFVERVAR